MERSNKKSKKESVVPSQDCIDMVTETPFEGMNGETNMCDVNMGRNHHTEIRLKVLIGIKNHIRAALLERLMRGAFLTMMKLAPKRRIHCALPSI